MLEGKELGKAVRAAVELKIKSGSASSLKEVAEHFGIKPPSLHGWMKNGTIKKSRLQDLWDYFSDVVEMKHWGISGNTVTGGGNPQAKSAIVNVKTSILPYGISKIVKNLEEIGYTLTDGDVNNINGFINFQSSRFKDMDLEKIQLIRNIVLGVIMEYPRESRQKYEDIKVFTDMVCEIYDRKYKDDPLTSDDKIYIETLVRQRKA